MIPAEDKRISEALEIIAEYGWIDGGHHKQWVLDQVARVLAGKNYDDWRQQFLEQDNGDIYDGWEEGIAP